MEDALAALGATPMPFGCFINDKQPKESLSALLRSCYQITDGNSESASYQFWKICIQCVVRERSLPEAFGLRERNPKAVGRLDGILFE